MTFIGRLNEKYYYIYPSHAADFHNETQKGSGWLLTLDKEDVNEVYTGAQKRWNVDG